MHREVGAHRAIHQNRRSIGRAREHQRDVAIDVDGLRLLDDQWTGEAAIGLVGGVGASMIFAAMGYASTRGKRDFVSQSQLVARRYDVLCQPRNAEAGRNLLYSLG